MTDLSEEIATPPISLPGDEYVQRGSSAWTSGTVKRRKTIMRIIVRNEFFSKVMHFTRDS
jgi:hypothetical protein